MAMAMKCTICGVTHSIAPGSVNFCEAKDDQVCPMWRVSYWDGLPPRDSEQSDADLADLLSVW